MSIQSSINQTLSLASLLVSQNPEVRAAGEKAAKLRGLEHKKAGLADTRAALTTRGEEIAKKAEDVYTEYHTSKGKITSVEMHGDIGIHKDVEAYEAESADLNAAERETAKELFELSPSEETYADYRATFGDDPTAFKIKRGFAVGGSKSELNLERAERRVARWEAKAAAAEATETRAEEISSSRRIARAISGEPEPKGLKPMS